MKQTINCSGKLINFSEPKVMGIINVTPDSFFDGGKFEQIDEANKRAQNLIEEGADIIDLGAASTRPGANQPSEKEELNRLIPVVSSIRKNQPEAIISIDTYRASVAKAAVEVGADIINDISGGTLDKKMHETIVRLKVPYVLMHMQGRPASMQQNPRYKNVTNEVIEFFIESLAKLEELGVHDVIIDPGFGFGKTNEHNYQLLNNLADFRVLNCPILVGISRKSMINKVLNVKPENALNGTTALNMAALLKGAAILRVHDAKEASETVKLFQMLRQKPF
ncbi:MAG: dihydropteroate synthase [Salibacteraceae bacterium]